MNLIPGMQFASPVRPEEVHTYIGQCRHPFYRGLQLVIWRLADKTISLDALDAKQDVGQPLPGEPGAWRENVRQAIFSPGGSS